MSSVDLQAVLVDLLGRVTGLRGAILLDNQGLPIAQASQEPGLALEAAGAGAGLLLRETLAAAERLQQGAVGEVLLEAERMTLAMIPLRNSCCLCLFLEPEAVLGRGLFEARKAAFALEQSL
jgi:predicted regulator of Ras-like GTPase activity (Roadblock/LC7/MglB family)